MFTDRYKLIYKGKHFKWYMRPEFYGNNRHDVDPLFEYPDRVYEQLEHDLGFKFRKAPYLGINPRKMFFDHNTKKWEEVHFASTGLWDDDVDMPYFAGAPMFMEGMTLPEDAFYNVAGEVKGYWAYVLLLHELTNTFTGYVTQEWPRDWWANHRSPFPNMVDYKILEELGYTRLSDIQKGRFLPGSREDAAEQVRMFDKFQTDFGWEMFRRMFRLIKKDRMYLDGLRDPPDYNESKPFVSGNPSSLRSHYTAAYMAMGAGIGSDVVAERLNTAGVGKKPANWDTSEEIKQRGPYVEYMIEPEKMDEIIECREILKEFNFFRKILLFFRGKRNELNLAWKLYRFGDYKEARKHLDKLK